MMGPVHDRPAADQLMRSAIDLTLEAWAGAVPIGLLYLGIDLILDRLFGDSWPFFALFLLISFILNVIFVLLLLRHLGVPLAGSSTAMVARGFLAALVTSIGIILGFVLLIVPGIYLLTRWYMVVPVIMAEGGGVLTAARRSAGYTKGRFGALCAAVITIWVPYILAFGALTYAGVDQQPFVDDFILLPLEALAFVVGCSLSVVACLEFSERGRLEKVFA